MSDALLTAIASWIDRHPGDAPQLQALLSQQRWDTLEPAFLTEIRFGTGGLRGTVGLGPGCLNPERVRQTVASHAAWLQDQGLDSVVIAWDGRAFADAAGRYAAEQPLRLLGWSSRDIARLAADVYTAAGLTVFLAERPTSTPELSFAVPFVHAGAGLCVTASHNPPDDNGLKLYDQRGVQILPQQAAEILNSGRPTAGAGRVLAFPEILAPFAEGVDAALCTIPGRPIRITASPLHGVSGRILRAALGDKVDARWVADTIDPAFSQLPGGAPNPERAEVLQALCEQSQDDLVICTDPDGDRLGVAVRHHGQWVRLSGQQLAELAVATLARPGTLVLRTFVTSSRCDAIARALGATPHGDFPVGFKFLGDAMRRADVPTSVAVEESHGLLIWEGPGDKDAAGAAAWLVRLASSLPDGTTLVDAWEALDRLAPRRFHALHSVVLEGADGLRQKARVLKRLEDAPPQLGDGGWSWQDRRQTAKPEWRSAEHAFVAMRGSTRLVVRPSGTEPKLKIYVEADAEPAAADELIRWIRDAG